MKARFLWAALALGVLATIPSHATNSASGTGANTTASDFVTAEVRKVDAEQGKITLKHGPIENLGMPPMTMVFRVADAAMLAKVKPGDQVKFKADRAGGAFRIVELVGQESGAP